MKINSVIIPFIFICLSCSDSNANNCEMDEAVLARNDSLLNQIDQDPNFSRFLQAMDEPKLTTLPDKAYRLSITYSFDRDTWIYRIEKTDNGARLRVEQTYQPGYAEYMNISDTIITKYLTEEDWISIEETFQSNCFWTIPVSSKRRGMDGANYILEAYDPDAGNPVNHTYHIAARWSPEDTTEFRKICNAIEKLGNSKLTESENLFLHN